LFHPGIRSLEIESGADLLVGLAFGDEGQVEEELRALFRAFE